MTRYILGDIAYLRLGISDIGLPSHFNASQILVGNVLVKKLNAQYIIL